MMAYTVLQAAGLVLAAATIVVPLIWLADRYLPERCVQERHDLALVANIMVPVLFLMSLRPARPGTVEAVAEPVAVSASADVAAPAATVANTLPDAVEATPAVAAIPWSALAIALWATVTLVLLGRLTLELRALLRLKATAKNEGQQKISVLSRPVPVRYASGVESPMLVGYFRPAILLPEEAAEHSVSRAVLEHEIAHAVRGDAWAALAIRIVNALFWWVLPLRLLGPIIHRNREMLADSYAAETTGAPVELAHALLDTATAPAPTPSLAAGAWSSAVPARVRRLGKPHAWHIRKTWARMSMMVPLVLIAGWVAMPRLGAAQSDSEDLGVMVSAWLNDGSEADLPLYNAALRGELDRVRNLVAAGEDPSALSAGDGTPLMAAVRGRHQAVLQFLLEAGADPNTKARGDGTALLAAVRIGEPAMVRRLLAAGADPSLAVSGDGTPLILAAHRGLTEIIDLLLAAGADPNGASPRDGNPLIAASMAGDIPAIRRLLAAGADPNGYVYRDETPLINAAQQGHLDVLNVLIEAGADVSLTVATPHHDPGGPYRSPLSEAKRHEHTDIVRRLIDLGAEHRVTDDE